MPGATASAQRLTSSLRCYADDDLAEIASVEHTDKGFRRSLKTVDDVLTISDAPIRDSGSNLTYSNFTG
jgi:hypothetical protein